MLSYIYWNQSEQIKHEIVSVTSSSKKIYTGSSTGEICFWRDEKSYLFCSSSSMCPCLYLCLASSPNKFLLCSKTLLISLHQDLKLRSWDSTDGRCMNSRKLAENIEIEGMITSHNRIIAIWCGISIFIIDAWTLNQIHILKPGGKIVNLTFLHNSKITVLNSLGELKFWGFESTNVQAIPYFVIKVAENCRKFWISHDCSLIVLYFNGYVEFRKMSDLKYDNHDVCLLKTSEIKALGFADEYIYWVSEGYLFRLLVSFITEELTPCSFLSLSKELSPPLEKWPIPSDSPVFVPNSLISFESSTLFLKPLKDIYTPPKTFSFSIQNCSISGILEGETVTYSDIIMKDWPIVLIGTSSGRIILQPLHPDQTLSVYTFHSSPITCISLSKNCVISCSQATSLCIYRPNKPESYCELLSPASRIVEVSCIQDTIHNISDSFWKNSWKNWDETVLIHCQDLSVVLISLYTNSVICSFSTRIPQVNEAQVHVLLEYLLIRSQDVVYVFNMMMQCLERVATGISASELLRKETTLASHLSSKSSDDLVCEQHRLIEANSRVMRSHRKTIHVCSLDVQGLTTPAVVIGEHPDTYHGSLVLSILTCWDKACSSHQSLLKMHQDMRRPMISGFPGIKGHDWQSFALTSSARTSKYLDSLVIVILMKIASVGCSLLRPSISALAMKTVTGCVEGQRIIKDMAETISASHRTQIVAACKEILKLRTPTSEAVRKTVRIVGSIPRVEIESEWGRVKNTLAESQTCVILAYFSSDLDAHSQLLVVTSLFSMLRSHNSSLIAAASKAIVHTFPVWKNLVGARTKEMIKELIGLSVNSPCCELFYKTIGTMIASDIKNYISLASEEINASEIPARRAWLSSLKWMISNKYDQLALYLSLLLEIILKTLSPHNPAIRKSCLDQASEILQILMAKLPMVAFSQARQRIAVGNMDNSISIYDLKTASFWKALEGHEAPVSAVIFSKNGDTLVSYSAQDFSLRVWKIEIGFFQGLVGVKNIKPSNVVSLPEIKRSVCNFREFLDCVSLQWKNDEIRLIREDSRAYLFSV